MRQTLVLLALSIGTLATLTMPTAHANNLPTPQTVTQNLDGVAAVVNNEVITQSELNVAVARAKQQMVAEHAPNIDDDKLKTTLLNQLINEKLQLQLAKRANIKVSSAEVDKAISHIARANHLTLKQLKLKLREQGFNYADYKRSIHNQILMHQVQMSALGKKVEITKEDTQKFLNKYKAQLAKSQRYHVLDLLIPVDTDNKAAVQRAKATAIAQMKSWRSGKGTDVQPTDLGWQTADSLPNIFLTQLTHMHAGDIAGPILAPNGFHVIKLVAHKSTGPDKIPSESQLKNMVFQMKMQKAVKKWLKNLRKTAYISITP